MGEPFDHLTSALADRYLLERELGAGGMATVFLAHDPRHNRKVAVKVMHHDLATLIGPERFLKEIETTANLQHPNILPLFDSGRVAGTVFFVMPYLEGESLRRRLDRDTQLPVADAIRIATEIAAGLDYAHRRGVVHRDVKPDNVLFHDGRAMVADFGIALARSDAEGGSRLTRAGVSLGTPEYMSPEQISGEHKVDPRSDIYSLGAVLYEMLSGRPPFSGPSVQAIYTQIITDDPEPLVHERKATPPHVDAAVRRALEKLPADRWQTAGEFAQALAGTGAAEQDEAAPPGASCPGALRRCCSPPLAGWPCANGQRTPAGGRDHAVQRRAGAARAAHLHPDRAHESRRPAALHHRDGEPERGGAAPPARPDADGGDPRRRAGRPGNRQQPALRLARREVGGLSQEWQAPEGAGGRRAAGGPGGLRLGAAEAGAETAAWCTASPTTPGCGW